MKRRELWTCTLNSIVKLTPQGRVYRVVMSPKHNFEAALEDVKTKKVKTPSVFISVYEVERG